VKPATFTTAAPLASTSQLAGEPVLQPFDAEAGLDGAQDLGRAGQEFDRLGADLDAEHRHEEAEHEDDRQAGEEQREAAPERREAGDQVGEAAQHDADQDGGEDEEEEPAELPEEEEGDADAGRHENEAHMVVERHVALVALRRRRALMHVMHLLSRRRSIDRIGGRRPRSACDMRAQG